jgi:hypothetical protein
MRPSNYQPPAGQPVNRKLFIKILNTALFMNEYRFARQVALTWLADYPGDLPVNLLFTQVLQRIGHPDQARSILERLCMTDPEYIEAALALLNVEMSLRSEDEISPSASYLRPIHRHSNPADTLGCVFALGAESEVSASSSKQTSKDATTVATWSHNVKRARQALKSTDANHQKTIVSLDQAEEAIHSALSAKTSTPLIAVTHLRLLLTRGTQPKNLRSLAEFYLQQWPECLQFKLVLAEALIEGSQPEKAVSLLHQAVSSDITGQVAKRLWGQHHPYRSLWPDCLETYIDAPIPASISAVMGWNQLPEGEQVEDALPDLTIFSLNDHISKNYIAPKMVVEDPPFDEDTATDRQTRLNEEASYVPESLISVQTELERVANRLNKPGLAHADRRFPVYVIMTSRQGLESKYGIQPTTQIEAAMEELNGAVSTRRGWRAMIFYADEGIDPTVKAAKHNDPWALKLALTDLDASLKKKGEMIGALLIVGGPDIVPFHHLPNPVDDADDDIPSDNPYGTRDENYFIPEWPVGRLPGGSARDIAPLMRSLSDLSNYHTEQVKRSDTRSWYRRLWENLVNRLRGRMSNGRSTRRKRSSFGYTAAIWQKTSSKVFRPIGEPGSLHVSPPVAITSDKPSPLPSARLGYFNLHGLIDAVEWYGQRESFSTNSNGRKKQRSPKEANENQEDYPVAVRPQDIVNSGQAPEVVFSEACYGAHILGKTIEEALALKFLQAGCQAVVGSTCTAYGSVNTPLTAADLLGYSFWSYLKRGNPAGEALRRAKITLAREMHRRQGYLDGEDQKTLISFVLYGDPLAQPIGPTRAKSFARPQKPVNNVKTICDRAREDDLSQPVPQEVMTYVKNIVEQYLPGMDGAEVTLSHEHVYCDSSSHICPTAQIHSKSHDQIAKLPDHKRRLVVLSKEVVNSSHIHQHYARITLDENNRLVKLVVSR